MGSKRPAGQPVTGWHNSFPSPTPYYSTNVFQATQTSESGSVSSAAGASRVPAQSTAIPNRGRPLNAVQVATAQSHLLNASARAQTPAQPASSVQPSQRAQNLAPMSQRAQVVPQPRPQPQSQAQYIPPSSHSENDYSPNSCSASDFILTVNALLEAQSTKIADFFTPRLDAIWAELASVKESCTEVKEEVTKVKADVRSLIEKHKTDHTATTEALKGFAQKAEALEVLLGESQLVSSGRLTSSLISRSDDMSSTFRDLMKKSGDQGVQAPGGAPIRAYSRPELNVNPLNSLHSQNVTPTTPTSSRFSTANQGKTLSQNQSRTQSIESVIQGPASSTDIEMGEEGVQPQTGPNAEIVSSQPQNTFDPIPTSSLKPRSSVGSDELACFDQTCGVNSVQKKANESLHGFSKVDWKQVERRSPLTTQQQPPSRSPSWRNTSGAPPSPNASLDDIGIDKALRRPSPLINVEMCPRETPEVQQLPSPLDLLPLSKPQSQSSRAVSRVASEASAKVSFETPYRVSSQNLSQSSSQVPYYTPDQSFSHDESSAPPHTVSQPQVRVEVEATAAEQAPQLPSPMHQPEPPRTDAPSKCPTIYDKFNVEEAPLPPPSPQRITSAVSLFVQNKALASLVKREVGNASLDVSPAMSLSLLPELGYPTRETTVDPEVQDEVQDEAQDHCGALDDVEAEDKQEDVEVLKDDVRMEVAGDDVEMAVEEARIEKEVVKELFMQPQPEVQEQEEELPVREEEEEAVEEEERPAVSVPQLPTDESSLSPEDLDTPVHEPLEVDKHRLSGFAAESQDGRATGTTALVVKTKVPLFLPESTLTPELDDEMGKDGSGTVEDPEATTEISQSQVRRDQEEEEATSRTLLPSPEPSPHDDSRHSPSPGSSIYASPKSTTSPPKSQNSTIPCFSPPATPLPAPQQALAISPDGSGLEYASRMGSQVPTSPVRQQTPIIDVSQLVPSQALQTSPERGPSPHPPTPQSLDQPDMTTPTPTRPNASQIMSSQEAAQITAQLTTLSEPESSSDGEDQDDDDDEDQLFDELLPSEPPRSQEESLQTFTTVGDQTLATESSIQTFTSVLRPKDSIQSFDSVEPAARKNDQPLVNDGVVDEIQEEEQIQVQADVDQSASQPVGDKESSPQPETELEPQMDHQLEVQFEFEPQVELQPEPQSPEQQEDSFMDSTPVKSRSRQGKHAAVTPVQLPKYLSPVNSPGKSPFPSLGSGLGGFGLGNRKRKLDEMRAWPEVVVEQPLGKEKRNVNSAETAHDDIEQLPALQAQAQPKSPVNASSASPVQPMPSAVRKDVSTPQKSRADSTSVNERDGGSQKRKKKESKVVEREGSPIYISSTPNTPELPKNKPTEKDNDVECIDLTDSPVLAKKRANTGSKKDKGITSAPSSSASGRSAATQKSRAQRAKELREAKRQKEKEEAEARENERKRKRAEERKKMPLGAEDSDEADIRPAANFKRPDLNFASSDEEDTIENGQGRPPATQPVPSLNFKEIHSRHIANSKNSGAQTRIKKRSKPSLSSTSANTSGATGNAEEPPLKRARNRSEDTESTVSGGGLNKRRSPRKSMGEDKSPKREKKKEDGTKPRSLSGLADLRTEPPSSLFRVKWPVKRDGARHDKNFIECDSCHTWYHNGCVGIQRDDVRMKDTEIFACPPCLAGRDPASCTSSTESCGRPDCAIKKTTVSQDEFFVKRLIGRRVKVEGDKGRVEEYLVEWDSYPIGEATWEMESAMGDPVQLIKDFVEAAEREGLDLDADPYQTVLLRDARRSGWRSDDEE